MRTTKRFTPDVLDRFRREGRGTGIYQNYIPWHRVSRGDPASMGRSHLQMWQNRQRELLSDFEWVIFMFSTMLSDIEDIREQFPLSLEPNPHELSAYGRGTFWTFHPGTVQLAKDLRHKHPLVNGNGRSAPWVMTTDFVLTLKSAEGKLKLLAVACKQAEELQRKRTKQLLEIEQAYWLARDVEWLLITPELYDKSVGLTLRNTMPWALGQPVRQAEISIASAALTRWYGNSLSHTLQRLALDLGDIDLAQRAFWQGVWSGQLPIDLRRGWRPHVPVKLILKGDFFAQNPIAAMRSAWI